jgi:uncharacterized protein GlcG (DUF336 family)
MTELTLEAAQTMLTAGLAHARANKMNPLGLVIVDARGALKASAMEDGTSLMRWKVAFGKAYGGVAWGVGTRKLSVMAAERPQFMAAASHLSEGGLLPVAGGVLIRDAHGHLLGAFGVSGDTSDNDELVASVGIAAAGLVADGG